MQEACITGRPAGGPGAASCTLRTSKSSWHGSCDTCPLTTKPKCKGDTDARCCWTDAGDEERSTWRQSPGGAQDVVANPSPVKLNSLLALRGFWSSPSPLPHMYNMCIHLSTCFGGSRISCCYQGEKQPENLVLNYYDFKGLPCNMTYNIMKSKIYIFLEKGLCRGNIMAATGSGPLLGKHVPGKYWRQYT